MLEHLRLQNETLEKRDQAGNILEQINFLDLIIGFINLLRISDTCHAIEMKSSIDQGDIKIINKFTEEFVASLQYSQTGKLGYFYANWGTEDSSHEYWEDNRFDEVLDQALIQINPKDYKLCYRQESCDQVAYFDEENLDAATPTLSDSQHSQIVEINALDNQENHYDGNFAESLREIYDHHLYKDYETSGVTLSGSRIIIPMQESWQSDSENLNKVGGEFLNKGLTECLRKLGTDELKQLTQNFQKHLDIPVKLNGVLIGSIKKNINIEKNEVKGLGSGGFELVKTAALSGTAFRTTLYPSNDRLDHKAKQPSVEQYCSANRKIR